MTLRRKSDGPAERRTGQPQTRPQLAGLEEADSQLDTIAPALAESAELSPAAKYEIERTWRQVRQGKASSSQS